MKTKMECIECDYSKPLKGARIIHKYKESGLDYITLAGIEEFKCPQCGAVYFEIPKVRQLHKLISNMIMQKASILTGPEIRFLRKELGYSTEQFGRLISYDSKTLSRIENGHQKVTPTFDKLIRMAYVTGQRDLSYNLHDYLLGNGLKYRRLELSIKGSEDWELKKKVAA